MNGGSGHSSTAPNARSNSASSTSTTPSAATVAAAASIKSRFTDGLACDKRLSASFSTGGENVRS